MSGAKKQSTFVLDFDMYKTIRSERVVRILHMTEPLFVADVSELFTISFYKNILSGMVIITGSQDKNYVTAEDILKRWEGEDGGGVTH